MCFHRHELYLLVNAAFTGVLLCRQWLLGLLGQRWLLQWRLGQWRLQLQQQQQLRPFLSFVAALTDFPFFNGTNAFLSHDCAH